MQEMIKTEEFIFYPMERITRNQSADGSLAETAFFVKRNWQNNVIS
jgi:hypothetical protein